MSWRPEGGIHATSQLLRTLMMCVIPSSQIRSDETINTSRLKTLEEEPDFGAKEGERYYIVTLGVMIGIGPNTRI